MTRSMTGFGKADCEFEGERVWVEVSAVNHRFLDCVVRLPSPWSAIEPVVKEAVRQHISRGKVNVTIARKRGAAFRQTVVFDRETAKQYLDAARELAQLLGTYDSLSLDVLAQFDGVFYQEEPEEDLDRVQAAVVPLMHAALERLDDMRTTEGRALEQEVRSRLGLAREALGTIEQRLPELNALYEQRLRTRIEELNADVSLTEERIGIEIAVMADKFDVTEEVVRLKTHLDHANEILTDETPGGRELNFLVQEIHREVNTLGAKLRDGETAKEVLRMKSEVERIREQVQNIE